MPDQMTIYRQHADQYDQLTAHEDYEQRLYPALAAIRSFDHADVVEWGAGTGRVSALVAPYARSIVAGDLHAHMLHVAAAKYRQFEHLKWHTVAMDHRHAPLPDRVADVAIAGWTLCYLARKFCGEIWQQQLTQAIDEMRRVLRPGGTIIIIETLGTGETEPHPMADWFAEYFDFLENDLGFQRHRDPHRSEIRFVGSGRRDDQTSSSATSGTKEYAATIGSSCRNAPASGGKKCHSESVTQ